MNDKFRPGSAVVLLLGVLASAIVPAGCASSNEPDENPIVAINHVIASRGRAWETTKEYIVEPPDVLLITVKDNLDLRTEVPVRPDGRISLPLLGDVFVAGKTVAGIERELENGLSRYIRRVDATVGVTEFASKKVFVYGEVENPGVYAYTGHDSVVDVIARAGTLNWRASPNEIQVARGDPNNPTIIPVRLMDIVVMDDDVTNLLLEPGDIVWVPPTTVVEVGDVARQIFWPVQWLLAPANVYSTYDDLRR